MYTYDDIAEEVDTTKEALYTLASRHPELFEPTERDGNMYLFDQAAVDRITAWWEEHSRFRSTTEELDEDAYTAEELEAEHELPYTTIRYYRRRYGMLYPDYYAPNPAGRGRPVAMYRKSTIDKWRSWVKDGRPEPYYANVREVILDQGRFRAMVYFRDGTVAGMLPDGEWRLSPPPDDPEDAQRYILFAQRRVEQKQYGQKWNKKDKSEDSR